MSIIIFVFLAEKWQGGHLSKKHLLIDFYYSMQKKKTSQTILFRSKPGIKRWLNLIKMCKITILIMIVIWHIHGGWIRSDFFLDLATITGFSFLSHTTHVLFATEIID